MSEQTTEMDPYIISVHEASDGDGSLGFTLTLKSPTQRPKCAPQYNVAVRSEADELIFDWSTTTDQPGPARAEMEAAVTARVRERQNWIERVGSLVTQVEGWAKELGWATRRIEKRLEDARIGTHKIPALLLQEGACRCLLEPVGRSAPGVEGVVDLYLMPAYDDIATLYYLGNAWQLHFPTHHLGTNGSIAVADTRSIPLSKESLGQVLAEMRKNAA